MRGAGPHGSGRTHADRAPRDGAPVASGSAWTGIDWTPHEAQRAVLAARRGIVVAVGGIGSGKSETLGLWLLRQALALPRRPDGLTPTQWFVVGPEFAQIRRGQFPILLRHAKRLQGLGYGSVVRRVVYGLEPRIELRDGQVLLGMSGDQYRRMEGPDVDGAWLDEAQRQPEAAFTTAGQRHRSATDLRIGVSASPEDSPGWLWRLISGTDDAYNELRRRTPVRVFRWSTSANKANTGHVVGAVRALLEAGQRGLAAQKTGGRFRGTPEAPSHGAIDVSRAFVPRLVLTEEEARPVALGVDLAESRDWTWFTVLSARGVVLAQERFNNTVPGVPRSGFWSYVADRIRATAERWRVRVVVVDSAKTGAAIVDGFEVRPIGEGVKAEGFPTFVEGKKAEAIEAASLALTRGEIRVPDEWALDGGMAPVHVDWVDYLRKEWEELVPHEGQRGKRTWDHPPNGHDDGPVSLALAWHGLRLAPRAPVLVEPEDWDLSAFDSLGSRRF